jgi:Holliday junction resolvasome RuvABC DNA-binding subunit
MIKQKHKNIEPIEKDCSLKYLCPDCSNVHWISLREARTKNFKIVCECNTIIIPKRIKKLKTVFCQKKIKQEVSLNKPKQVVIPPVPKNTIQIDIQNKCIEALRGFGYCDDEIKKILPEALEASRTNHIKLVIDYLLKNLGEKHE